MAHYQPGAAGEFRGRMGQTVMYRWRHLKIGRSRPSKTSKPPKLVSKTQRSRMGILSRYMGRFTEVVRDGFPVKRKNMTSMNAAIKYNWHTAFKGEYPNVEIDPAKIQISKGTLDDLYRPVLEVLDQKVMIRWQVPSRLRLGVEMNDRLYVVAFRDGLRLRAFRYLKLAGVRGDGLADISDIILEGETTHVWMFLVAADGKKCSNSRYMGSPVFT